MLHVDVGYVFMSVPCSRLERADLLSVVCVMFSCIRSFPKCFLDHIRIKGELGAVKLV